MTKRKPSKARAREKRKQPARGFAWPSWDDPRIAEPWAAYERDKKERET